MAASDRAPIIRLPLFGWCIVALVVLGPWGVLAWVLRPAETPSPLPEKLAAIKVTSTPPLPIKRGPWGQLESTRIMIEPPEEFIPTELGDLQPCWVFRGYSDAKLDALWAEAGLTAEQRKSLADSARRDRPDPDTLVIRPDPELILGLSTAARAKIYVTLAEFPENGPQREPFRFRADMVDEWFAGSKVAPATITLTRQLLYPRHISVYFSDHQVVLDRLPVSERTTYLKTLSRKSALLVKVRVQAEADVDELARYWGRGRRAKDVRPLLQSLLSQPGGGVIDLVHLLPHFPRGLLYTYPLPSERTKDGTHDCHWTSFNFYNDEPDERFTDIDFVKKKLFEDYYLVQGEPALGDIVMFLQPGGVVVHSCVYVADNIVFTKNGPSYAVPWLLSELNNVIAFYSLGSQPLEIRRYRPKGL